jgi:hypothetical protein
VLILLSLLDAGLALFVNLVFTFIDEPRLAFVFLSCTLLETLIGAVQVLGLATILPLRVPELQRYLRTVLLPLRPYILVAPSVNISSIFMFIALMLCLASALCDLQDLFS